MTSNVSAELSADVEYDSRRDGRRPIIAHFGQYGEIPGGMAQVLNEYMRWEYQKVELRAYRTTADKHDPLAALRTFGCMARIVGLKLNPRDKACVVHMSQGGSFVREGLLVWFANLLRIPVATHMHGSRFAVFAARRPQLVKFVLRRTAVVFALTTDTVETVRRLTCGKKKISSPQIEMVPNAVSLGAEETVSAGSKNIVMAGVLGRRKGVDVLLEAWTLMGERRQGWKLQLVGPRSDEIQEWPALPGIEYVGPEEHCDLLRRLGKAEIAVLVARDEALPMFILEAMAHGCCVVSTPVGQIPDVVSEATGFLVPVGDAPATADALIRLIENSPERRAKSMNARSLIKAKYSEESAKPVLEDAWWRLAGNGRLRNAS